MTHDELLARLDLSNEHLIPYEEFEKRNSALRAVVELPSEITIERHPDELTAVGHSDESYVQGYRYAMHLVIQAIEKELG